MYDVGQMSSIIQSGVAVAGLLGSGLAFVWVRVEAINRKTKAELKKCNAREQLSRERRSALLTAFDFVLLALHRRDPRAPEIEQSRRLIEDLRARDLIDAQSDPQP